MSAPQTINCPECNGDGFVFVGRRYECPECNGHGTVAACPECHGEGGWDDPRSDEGVTCEHCDGTGADPHRDDSGGF
ncbi:hypothetical protein HN937_08800 [Candidatus Poribacteria bacterium]|jgi:DnaJ-class molecular chaperone|nr:hypothetical protein [Candidatus Poribacteria bacterium]